MPRGVYPRTPECNKKHSDGMKKYHKEHPDAGSAAAKKFNQEHPGFYRKFYNTPEELALIQQYGSSLIDTVRHKYHDLNYRCKPYASCHKHYYDRGIRNLFPSPLHFLLYVINELHITTFEQIEDLEIDRIDNNSHYMPGNIRFVTHQENLNNRRPTSLS